MLELLANALIALLTAYLAFTNALADRVSTYLDRTLSGDEFALHEDAGERRIPDILLTNPAFQQAAVIESTAPTAEPAATLTDALVNIYCTYTTDSYRRQTTGSGYLVSESGVVLTNAHVAQFLLLEQVATEGDAACVIRTGEPATARYEAELLYISPSWIQENAAQIAAATPRGTGERDYALLYIARSLGTSPLPARFPFLAVETELLRKSDAGTAVTIGGYPVLGSDYDLTVTQKAASSSIVDIYTFASNYGDILLLSGTSIGEQGISGGPVVRENGAAIGLITTRGDDTLQGSGSLNAITTSYIDRTMREETGYGFVSNISGNLPYRSEIFNSTLTPFLAAILENHLN